MTVYKRSVRNRALQATNKNTNDNYIINQCEIAEEQESEKLILNILPNRKNPISENITFNTDIIESFDGTEQRIPLLQEPRNIFTYNYTLLGKDLQKFNVFLQKNQSNNFFIPVFTETRELLKDTVIGESNIIIDTIGSRLQYDLDFIIMNPYDKDDYEIFKYFGEDKIQNRIFVGKNLTRVWPKDSWVIPIIEVRLIDRVQKVFPNATDRLAGFQVKFQKEVGEDSVIIENEIDYPIYKDLYIIDRQPNKTTRMTQSWQRKLIELDYGYGKTYTYDRSNQSFTLFNYNWTLTSLRDIINLKTFFNNIKGRLTSFWYASNENELTSINTSYTLIDTVLKIDNIGLNTFYTDKELNIKINFTDGTYLLREVTAIIDFNDTEEQLFLDQSFGKNFDSSKIDSISILYLSRFNNDDFVFAYINNDICEIQKNILVEKIGDL